MGRPAACTSTRSCERISNLLPRLAALLIALAVLPSTAMAQTALAPGFSKVFSPDVVAQNSVVPLFFSITNPNSDPNPNVTLTGIAFTDNLPAGLVVATPSQVSSDCGGTVTAVAGSSTISLSGGALDPTPPLGPTPKSPTNAQGSCTISVMVLVSGTGSITNTTDAISTNESGVGSTTSASVTVIAALDVQKFFNAPSLALGGTTTLIFTITDPANPALSNGQINDTLPAGLVVANPTNAATTCSGGTVNATAGGSSVSLSGFSFPAGNGDSCQFSADVTGISAGMQNNLADALTMEFDNGTESPGVVGSNQASASVDVVAPPSIAKAFGPSSIALGATTSLTFTITNPAGNDVSQDGVAFNDTLPTGLTVANASATACGGTLTTTAPTGIALVNGSLAVNSQCQFSVTVTGASAGEYTNTTGAVSAAFGDGGSITGNTATANLVVVAPPGIAKSFAAGTIPLNGTTTVDFAISNTNPVPLSGLAFTDNLPAGLVVGSGTATSNCGGTLTAAVGSSSIVLSGGSLPAGGNVPATCDVVVPVQGTSAGFKLNSVSITSTEGGTGNTASSAVTVIPPPAIAKSFGAASIPLNGSTSLSFTITNQDPESAQSGVAVSDTLPAGLVVATPNGLTGSCGAGTISATAGSNNVSLSGGTLGGGGSCTFSINVTGTSAGTKNNVSGNVSSTEGGTGNTASAALDVEGAPSIAKAFSPTAIALNATTTLTFTITNPAANALALSGVAFNDTLPAGLTVASAASSVCGGTLTTTAPATIALTGASINSGAQCQFAVTVTGATAGQFTNTTGAVTSTNGGTGNTATANLTVAAVPTISKAFAAATIALNGTTTLTFTLVNPNTTPLSGLGFTDSLPAGLAVAASPGTSNTCGGTLTAAAGSSSIVLSGGSLAGGASCTVAANVTGTSAGVLNNTTGPITSNESGAGAPSNTATLTVFAPPTIAKAFGAASVPQFGSTSLSFTLTNPNASALTGVAFSDSLPSGLSVSSPNGLTGSCGGGSITAAAGSSTVSLAGASLAANGACTFAVNVTANAVGTQNNVTGNVASTEGGTGGTASASLQVNALTPPTLAKAFGVASLPQFASTSLSFTITNPNPASTLSGIGFSDTLPSGLLVASPNALSGSCGGGTISAAAGSGAVALSGATLAGNASCTFSVNVTANAVGVMNNVTGNITSTEAGAGGTAQASLQVGALAPPTIAKAFGATSSPIGATTSLTFTITNPNPASTLTGIGFTDALPGGLLVANPNALSGTCGAGTITAVAGTSSVTLSGATLAGGSACTFSVNIVTSQFGSFVNITGPVSSNETGPGARSNAAVLRVGAGTPTPTPALDHWMLLLLGAALAWLGVRRFDRRAG